MNIDENGFQTYLEQHNPYGFKDDKNTFMYFKTHAEAYEELLKRLRERFFEGYIDMVVYLCEAYGSSLSEAESEVRSWERRGFHNPLLVEWGNPSDARLLMKVAQNMMFITDSSFKKDLFMVAFDKFTNDLKNGKYGKVTRRDE